MERNCTGIIELIEDFYNEQISINFFLILSNCSFDDKTGIWTNNNKKESSKETI